MVSEAHTNPSNRTKIDPGKLEQLGLGKREAEVLFWTGKGYTAQEVAEIMTISELTVKKHLQNGYKKLGVKNRTLAITTSLERLGLLAANDWTSG
jgi:DNA-binding CsgD family transcriptional regulator